MTTKTTGDPPPHSSMQSITGFIGSADIELQLHTSQLRDRIKKWWSLQTNNCRSKCDVQWAANCCLWGWIMADNWIKVINTGGKKKQAWFIASRYVDNFSSGHNFSVVFTICHCCPRKCLMGFDLIRFSSLLSHLFCFVILFLEALLFFYFNIFFTVWRIKGDIQRFYSFADIR